MKLINVDSNFSVESFKLGNMTVEFVHNNKTMESYFPQKVLSDLFGIGVDTVSHHLNKYLKVNENLSNNIQKIQIKLKTSNRGRKTIFYGFDAVTYLAFRINTPEAINVRNFISQTLNTMFNVATGKTDWNTKMDKIKNLYEVEEFKAGEYLQAHEHVIKFDKKTANILYNKYKISKANALNCHEILMNNRALDKRADEVINTIEPRTDGSKQLLLF